MKPLAQAVDLLLRNDPLLVFDFDGTLAPIVRNPDAAAMRPSTKALLGELTAIWPCAVVSGRASSDLICRLGGLRFRAVVGNHGAEWGRSLPVAAAARRDVQKWLALLVPALGEYAHVRIEDKGLSLTIHHRGALPELPRILSGLARARIVGGKNSVNVIPARLPDKGDAVLRLGRQFRPGAILYVGDDESDEDVFRLETTVELVSVRVGASPFSRARYSLPAQADIDELLCLLLEGAAHARLSA
jgi:trehalose 6-phosphate phosphatase